jgi:quercetin dioxygenase-like cupin family protein
MTIVSSVAAVAPVRLAEWGEASARVLHRHATGESVAQLELPAGWALTWPPPRARTLEIFVLTGELTVAGATLTEWSYLHVPVSVPLRLASSRGATILVYADLPQPTDGTQMRIVATTSADWRSGVIAARDTGRSLALEVRDLLNVPSTGQRTWLLRAGADLVLPFERHQTVEEGYIVHGRYRLIERLERGETVFDHEPGGYFWRPAGIVHGGPRSGSDGDFVMLLRTPKSLTVEFVP